VLAGVEIYATSQQSIGDMEIKIGPGGMAAYVIPLMLVVGGLLAWFTPAQRHFYGIVIPAVSVYALVEINFGGWVVGTVLGMAGGALIFAWAENKDQPVAEDGEPEPDGEYDDDDHSPRHAAMNEMLDGPSQPAIPRQGIPGDDDPVEMVPPAWESDSGRGRLLAIATVPLLLVIAGIVAAKGPEAAYAAPCRAPAVVGKVPVKPAKSGGTSHPAPAASTSPQPAVPAAEPSASPTQPAGLLHKIVGGIVHLLDPSPSPSDTTPAEPSPSPSAPAPSASRTVPKPSASKSGKPLPHKPTTPCASASAVPPAKRLRAAAGQPDVAAKPSRMTGSSQTMLNLVFQGVVDLPTADGPIKVLKFTMDKAVTEDFVLQTYARSAHQKDVFFRSKTLTVETNVVFYTSRFRGNLFGVIPVDYTPENPAPPIPLLIANFTDVDIQLAWVDAGVLTGTPSLTATLS